MQIMIFNRVLPPNLPDLLPPPQKKKSENLQEALVVLTFYRPTPGATEFSVSVRATIDSAQFSKSVA